MLEDDAMLFRVTGPQSIERLEPLLPTVISNCRSLCAGPGSKDEATDIPTPQPVHFVWETTCEQTWRDFHSNALVLNKLHNITILEDKANFAFLQLRMSEYYENVLPTFIAKNSHEALQWARNHWKSNKTNNDNQQQQQQSISRDQDWWVLKVAAGNGGKDIWVITKENFRDVIQKLNPPEIGTKVAAVDDEYVIQKYVPRPLLYKGKKFHFRCYTMLRADMSSLLYHMAYILTAGYNYNNKKGGVGADDNDVSMDVCTLISNMSVNKHIEGYPGQIPCNLTKEYPKIYNEICNMWKAVSISVSSFMKKQINKNHFEFFGIDVIADMDGYCWLLEINRLPGLESSKLNTVDEDLMYNEMMTSLLRIVLHPINTNGKFHSEQRKEGDISIDSNNSVNYGLWEIVHAPSAEEMKLSSQGLVKIHKDACTGADDAVVSEESGETQEEEINNFNHSVATWKNIFSWRAFTKRRSNRELVVLSSMNLPEYERTTQSSTKGRICASPDCDKHAPFQCSKCKNVSYCGTDHQKQHWKLHKTICGNTKMSLQKQVPNTKASGVLPSQPPSRSSDSQSQSKPEEDEVRISRCMFCGESVSMKCEEDGHAHMKICPALQEQLGNTEQFTIPKALRDKGVTLTDVKNAPTI
jgi:hypothetical protein